MRKQLLIITFLLLGVILYGQKIKIKKKNIFYIDKVEMGKIEGEVKWMKNADLKFYSKNGDLFMTLKENEFKPDNPLYVTDKYWWYNIEFKDTDKKMKLQTNAHWINYKQILKFLIHEKKFVFGDKSITNQDDLVKNSDYSDRLNSDTLAVIEKERKHREFLRHVNIKRDRTKPILLKPAGDGYIITQDKVYLGRIINKSSTSGPVIDRNLKFIVEIKTDKPAPDGNCLYLAQADESQVFFKVYTFTDNKWHKLKEVGFSDIHRGKLADGNTIKDVDLPNAKILVEYLVNKGYL